MLDVSFVDRQYKQYERNAKQTNPEGGAGTESQIILSGKEPRQLGDLVRNDMSGMLPLSEARMRMCVMQVSKRGQWTYRDWARWRFLWKHFPWYAREIRYRSDFCMGPSCMYWGWEDSEKKERGYCSAVPLLNVTRVPKEAEQREAVTLRPTIYGVGVDLKELWRRAKRRFRRSAD